MKFSYVIHSEPRTKISKPALYCMSVNGCFRDDAAAVAFCLRAHFRESKVAMSCVSRTSRDGHVSLLGRVAG